MRQFALLCFILAFAYISVSNYTVEQGKMVNIEGTVTLPKKGDYYTLQIQTDLFEIQSQSEYTYFADENYDKKQFSFLLKVPQHLSTGTYYVNLVLYNSDGTVLESKPVKIDVVAPSTYIDSELIEVKSVYYKMYDDEQKMIKFTSFLLKNWSIASYYLHFPPQSGNNLSFFFRHILMQRSHKL